jgi:Lysozyme like domain
LSDLYIVQRITRPTTPSVLYLPNNRLLTNEEVSALAGLYWPSDQVANAVAVSDCESNHWTGAWNYLGEDSRGLWQLNVDAHPGLIWWDLGDPQVNAYFAYDLWSRQGWWPWTCAKTLHLI